MPIKSLGKKIKKGASTAIAFDRARRDKKRTERNLKYMKSGNRTAPGTLGGMLFGPPSRGEARRDTQRHTNQIAKRKKK